MSTLANGVGQIFNGLGFAATLSIASEAGTFVARQPTAQQNACIYYNNPGIVANTTGVGKVQAKVSTLVKTSIGTTATIGDTTSAPSVLAQLMPHAKFSATTDPTARNDIRDSAGLGERFYSGSFWTNSVTGQTWVCLDGGENVVDAGATVGNAVWKSIADVFEKNPVSYATAAKLSATSSIGGTGVNSIKTITGANNGVLVIDGHTFASSDVTNQTRVLVLFGTNTNPGTVSGAGTDSIDNGIYIVTNAGSVSTPYTLVRAQDFRAGSGGFANVTTNTFTRVLSGASQAGIEFALTGYGGSLDNYPSNVAADNKQTWTKIGSGGIITVAPKIVVNYVTAGTDTHIGTATVSTQVGAGKTLTDSTAGSVLIIDGVAVNVGDRVLVTNGPAATDNGIYTVTVSGATSTPGPAAKWKLTRASDSDGVNGVLNIGTYAIVLGGLTGANTTLTLVTAGSGKHIGDLVSIDTDAQTWTRTGIQNSYELCSVRFATDLATSVVPGPDFASMSGSGPTKIIPALVSGLLLIQDQPAVVSDRVLVTGRGAGIDGVYVVKNIGAASGPNSHWILQRASDANGTGLAPVQTGTTILAFDGYYKNTRFICDYSAGTAEGQTWARLSAGPGLAPGMKLVAKYATTSSTFTGANVYDFAVVTLAATITQRTANGVGLNVDGSSFTLQVGTRVLVKNGTSNYHNGIYVVTDDGTGFGPNSNAWKLRRAADADGSQDGPVYNGISVMISDGTANINTIWYLSTFGTGALSNVPIINDSVNGAQIWTQLSTGGAVPAAPKLQVDIVWYMQGAILGDTVLGAGAGVSGAGPGKTIFQDPTIYDPLIIDGYTVNVGQRVLVIFGPFGSNRHNGIYVLTQQGDSGATPPTNWVLTRAIDADGSSSGQLANGVRVHVAEQNGLYSGIDMELQSWTGPVDDVVNGLQDWNWYMSDLKPSVVAPVKVATLSDLGSVTFAGNYGATYMQSVGNAALVIDGVTLLSGDRILVKNQSSPNENGIYTVINVGANNPSGHRWNIRRSHDFDGLFDTTPKRGSVIGVTSGTVNAGTTWSLDNYLTDKPINDITQPITFTSVPGTVTIPAAPKLQVDLVWYRAVGVAGDTVLGAGAGVSGAGPGKTIYQDPTIHTKLIIDGHQLLVGERVLIIWAIFGNSANAGIYVCTRQGQTGATPTSWVLTRASDADGSSHGQLQNGTRVRVRDGLGLYSGRELELHSWDPVNSVVDTTGVGSQFWGDTSTKSPAEMAPVMYATATDLGSVVFAGNYGATNITSVANGALTIDGRTFTSLDETNSMRILVKDQTNTNQNGIYYIDTAGDGGAPWVLVRSADFNGFYYTTPTVGSTVKVLSGAVNSGSGWRLDSLSQFIPINDAPAVAGTINSVAFTALPAAAANTIPAAPKLSVNWVWYNRNGSYDSAGYISTNLLTGTPFVTGAGPGKTINPDPSDYSQFQIDGCVVNVGDRVLVTCAPLGPSDNNGIYVLTQQGDAVAVPPKNWVLTRASDADGSAHGQLASGLQVNVVKLNDNSAALMQYGGTVFELDGWVGPVDTGANCAQQWSPISTKQVEEIFPVKYATVGNLPVTVTGTLDVTRLTSTTNGVLVLDGHTFTGTGDRVLVKDQTDTSQNGVYIVINTGSSGSKWVLRRADDFAGIYNQTPISKSTVSVLYGDVNSGSVWQLGNYNQSVPINTTGNHITFTAVPAPTSGTIPAAPKLQVDWVWFNSNGLYNNPALGTGPPNTGASISGAGPGKTIHQTSTDYTPFTIDGTVLNVGDRVLVTCSPFFNSYNNGIYVLTQQGDAGAVPPTSYVLTRASDADGSSSGQLQVGVSVAVKNFTGMYSGQTFQLLSFTGPVDNTSTGGQSWAAISSMSTLPSRLSLDWATTVALPAYTTSGNYINTTLTATANGALVIDGHTFITSNQLILVKNETAENYNGVYNLQAPGDSGNPWILVRDATFAGWYDNMPVVGSVMEITNGAVNAGTKWKLTDYITTVPINDASNVITFTELPAPSASTIPAAPKLGVDYAFQSILNNPGGGASGTGPGKTIHNNATDFTPLVYDNTVVPVGSRVLLMAGASHGIAGINSNNDNGIYVVSQQGDAGAVPPTNWVLTRAHDADGSSQGQIAPGMTVLVRYGFLSGSTFRLDNASGDPTKPILVDVFNVAGDGVQIFNRIYPEFAPIKAPVRVATASALPDYTTINKETSIKLTETVTPPATGSVLTIDGIPLSIYDRVLIKDETSSPLYNRIFIVNNVNDGSLPWELITAPDADGTITGALVKGTTVFVSDGVSNVGRTFVQSIDYDVDSPIGQALSWQLRHDYTSLNNKMNINAASDVTVVVSGINTDNDSNPILVGPGMFSPLTIDGVVLSVHDRVLLRAGVSGFTGSNSIYNGIYTVLVQGDGIGVAWSLGRAEDSNETGQGQLRNGCEVVCIGGIFNRNARYRLSNYTWTGIKSSSMQTWDLVPEPHSVSNIAVVAFGYDISSTFNSGLVNQQHILQWSGSSFYNHSYIVPASVTDTVNGITYAAGSYSGRTYLAPYTSGAFTSVDLAHTINAYIDGTIARNIGDKILLTAETNSCYNGVWVIGGFGAVGTQPWWLYRDEHSDGSYGAKIKVGDVVTITQGSVYNGAVFLCTVAPTNMNTDQISFIRSDHVSVNVLNNPAIGSNLAITTGGATTTALFPSSNILVQPANDSSVNLIVSGKDVINSNTANTTQINLGTSTASTVQSAASRANTSQINLVASSDIRVGTATHTDIARAAGTGVIKLHALSNNQNLTSGGTNYDYYNGTGLIKLQADNGVDFTGTSRIVTDPAYFPVSANYLTNKAYVDAAMQGFGPKSAVICKSTVADLTGLSANYGALLYTPGAAPNYGLGAVLAALGTGALVLDNYTVQVGDRVLLADSTDVAGLGKYYGIYTMTVLGGVAGSKWSLTRATDADGYPAAGEISTGNYTFVVKGDTQAGQGWAVSTVGAISFDANGATVAGVSGAILFALTTSVLSTGNIIVGQLPTTGLGLNAITSSVGPIIIQPKLATGNAITLNIDGTVPQDGTKILLSNSNTGGSIGNNSGIEINNVGGSAFNPLWIRSTGTNGIMKLTNEDIGGTGQILIKSNTGAPSDKWNSSQIGDVQLSTDSPGSNILINNTASYGSINIVAGVVGSSNSGDLTNLIIKNQNNYGVMQISNNTRSGLTISDNNSNSTGMIIQSNATGSGGILMQTIANAPLVLSSTCTSHTAGTESLQVLSTGNGGLLRIAQTGDAIGGNGGGIKIETTSTVAGHASTISLASASVSNTSGSESMRLAVTGQDGRLRLDNSSNNTSGGSGGGISIATSSTGAGAPISITTAGTTYNNITLQTSSGTGGIGDINLITGPAGNVRTNRILSDVTRITNAGLSFSSAAPEINASNISAAYLNTFISTAMPSGTYISSGTDNSALLSLSTNISGGINLASGKTSTGSARVLVGTGIGSGAVVAGDITNAAQINISAINSATATTMTGTVTNVAQINLTATSAHTDTTTGRINLTTTNGMNFTATSATATFDMGGKNITSVATPVSGTDAANKSYVDANGSTNYYRFNFNRSDRALARYGQNQFAGTRYISTDPTKFLATCGTDSYDQTIASFNFDVVDKSQDKYPIIATSSTGTIYQSFNGYDYKPLSSEFSGFSSLITNVAFDSTSYVMGGYRNGGVNFAFTMSTNIRNSNSYDFNWIDTTISTHSIYNVFVEHVVDKFIMVISFNDTKPRVYVSENGANYAYTGLIDTGSSYNWYAGSIAYNGVWYVVAPSSQTSTNRGMFAYSCDLVKWWTYDAFSSFNLNIYGVIYVAPSFLIYGNGTRPILQLDKISAAGMNLNAASILDESGYYNNTSSIQLDQTGLSIYVYKIITNGSTTLALTYNDSAGGNLTTSSYCLLSSVSGGDWYATVNPYINSVIGIQNTGTHARFQAGAWTGSRFLLLSYGDVYETLDGRSISRYQTKGLNLGTGNTRLSGLYMNLKSPHKVVVPPSGVYFSGINAPSSTVSFLSQVCASQQVYGGGADDESLLTSTINSNGIGIAPIRALLQLNNNRYIIGLGGQSTLCVSDYIGNYTPLGAGVFNTTCNSLETDGTIVIAGGQGTVNTLAYSYDGITWKGLGLNGMTSVTKLLRFKNMFVAVGVSTGVPMLYSNDGKSWSTATTTLTNANVVDADTNGRVLVLVTNTNLFYYTYNGINYYQSIAPVDITLAPFKLCYGDREFRAFTTSITSGISTGYTYKSEDGVVWLDISNSLPFSAPAAGFSLASVAYDRNSYYLLYGTQCGYMQVLSTRSPLNTYNITFSVGNSIGGGIFKINSYRTFSKTNPGILAFGTGNTTIAWSQTGTMWKAIGTTVFSTAAYCGVWTGSMWLVGGQGGNSLAYSKDNFNWTGLGTGTFSTSCKCICIGPGIIVAGGSGTNTVAYSTDGGFTWTGLGTSLFTTKCGAVAYHGGRFVAFGDNAGVGAGYYSSNGINWTAVTGPLSNNSSFTGACVINNGNSSSGFRFVAVGTTSNANGGSYYSDDGITYTASGNLRALLVAGFTLTSCTSTGTHVYITGVQGSGLTYFASSNDGSNYNVLPANFGSSMSANLNLNVNSYAIHNAGQTLLLGTDPTPVGYGCISSNTVYYNGNGYTVGTNTLFQTTEKDSGTNLFSSCYGFASNNTNNTSYKVAGRLQFNAGQELIVRSDKDFNTGSISDVAITFQEMTA